VLTRVLEVDVEYEFVLEELIVEETEFAVDIDEEV
jgi:hypothetical protein